MVQEVRIVLPAIPQIGIPEQELAEFRVPELSDIRNELDEALDELIQDAPEPLATLLRFAEEIEEQADPGEPLFVVLAQAVAVEVAEALSGEDLDFEEVVRRSIQDAVDDIDVPGLKDVEVDVGGSLFAVNEEFVDLLATALDQVDFLDVDGLGDMEGLIGDFEEFRADVEGFIDDLEEFRDNLEDFAADPDGFIRDSLNTVMAEIVATILRVETGENPNVDDVYEQALLNQGLDPEDPILDQLIDQQIDRVTNNLVSEDVRQDLQETVEDL